MIPVKDVVGKSFQSYFSLIKSETIKDIGGLELLTFNPILVWLNPYVTNTGRRDFERLSILF